MTIPRILVDTNVISFLMRGDSRGLAYAPHLQGKLGAISFVTVGEIYYGAEKARWGQARRMKIETALRNFVVIPYDHEIARGYGRIVADRERLGMPISFADAWIAACAFRHGTPLLTHNPKHFEAIPDLQVISEQI